MYYLLKKQRTTLNIECGDLLLKLINLTSDICDLLSAHQTNPSHKKIIQGLELYLNLWFTDSFLMKIKLKIDKLIIICNLKFNTFFLVVKVNQIWLQGVH